MWEIDRIDAHDATGLCSSAGRLFWLERQSDSEPIVDAMGRERRKTRLVTYSVDDRTRRVWATDLPPSDSLAACEDHAYLWGIDRESLVRVEASGEHSTVAEFDNAAEGALVCSGERLFYLGRTRPRQMGAAVFDPELDDFAQVVNLEGPTHIALQRMQVDDGGVWSLEHDARGWVMHYYPIDGEPTETVISEQKWVLRWMTRTDKWVAAAGSDGVYLIEGDEVTFVETEVPPDDLSVIDDRCAWVSAAMTDSDGTLVEPWRVMAAGPGESEAEVLLETDSRIASLTTGPWGCAVLTQETAGELDKLIEGDVQTEIQLATPD